jgi:transcriptional accessory protein Tex/SPT6
VRAALRERGVLVPVVVVSEAGLGAWSTSESARDELPEHDAGVRGAIGIARRLQDPLAELARAEPRTLATGPYVHDLSQPRLEKAMSALVGACVADVGVDVNRASDVLLSRVAGATPGLAHAIVEHRTMHGPFASLAELRAVPLMDARTFEQMEPFVRAGADGRRDADPRGVLAPVTFGAEVRTLADLRPGLVCTGVVTNVTTFGAFVDIGLPQDGLVHVSRIADQFVRDPHAVVRVGDEVEVRVVEVNRDKQQIALSMRKEAPARPAPAGRTPARQEQDARRDRPTGPKRDRAPKPRPAPAFNNPFATLATELRRGTPSDRSKGPSS